MSRLEQLIAELCPDGVEFQSLGSLVERLQGIDMEDLFISDLALDQSQALVTIVGIPNQPGVAAQVFQRIADAGVFVDMIVQSHKGYLGRISLSFTVPADQLPLALDVTQQLATHFNCHAVTHRPQVAKLSVSGIGLHSHTGVAIRMFRVGVPDHAAVSLSTVEQRLLDDPCSSRNCGRRDAQMSPRRNGCSERSAASSCRHAHGACRRALLNADVSDWACLILHFSI